MATVRQVESSDLPALSEVFPESPGAPINRHIQRFEWQQAGQITYLAAWNDRRLVGSVFVRWPGGQAEITDQGASVGCAEIGDLTVVEQARNQGIGRQLMEESEKQAKERGMLQLGLEVTATNPYQDVARILYKNLGYQECGFGTFVSGYTYWDADGNPHRDEEPYIYMVKNL